MFLDTSGLLALHNKRETTHGRAVQIYRSSRSYLTQNYVLAEFVALAHVRRLPRVPAVETVRDLIDQPNITVVWVDRTLHQAAVEFLLRRPDKAYSPL
jgi:predicted nucleic acid-binding protein